MFGMTKSKVTKGESLPEFASPEFASLDIPEFEAELGEVLDATAEEPLEFDEEVFPADAAVATEDTDTAAPTAPEPKQSTATRTNLAALAAFENEMRTAAASLDAMDTTLAAIGAAHETASRFLGNLRAGVLRANDFEEANAALSAENRRLSERLEQARHLQSQHESADEVNKRRIELLVKDYEEAKVTLGKAQIELVAIRDALNDTDAEKTALIYELATKSTSVERLSRETELLRQKFLGQQIANNELEQRYSELERKLEELASIRKGEMSEMAELRMRFDNTEKEYRRVQKLSDQSQVRLTETQERIMTLEADLDELRDRHGAMNERFRSEAEILKAKLEIATRKNIADADEIAALKLQVGDAVSAASVAGAQLACATGQIDAWRQTRPAAAYADAAYATADTKIIGLVSYDRERPGKKSKTVMAEKSRAGKPERPGGPHSKRA
ncbi:MAG: hypothetical protein WBA42_15395 [Mesorhizobium sp.]